MLAFVVPFISKKNCSDWEKTCALLGDTLKSITGQTVSGYKIYLVSDDEPEILKLYPQVTFLKPHPRHPTLEDFPDYKHGAQYSNPKHYSRRADEIALDISWKTTTGCLQAKKDGCSHVFKVDGDDLVSNQMASFVNSNLKSPGYYVSQGYVSDKRFRNVVFRQKNIQNMNGSTHIIRLDLIPTNLETLSFRDYQLFVAHGHTKSRVFNDTGETLKELPFPGIIVIHHKHSVSMSLWPSCRNAIKLFLKIALRGKLINRKMKAEFNLA